MVNNIIKITQIRSCIGCLPKHRATIIGLGLRYIGHTVIRQNTPEIQGMIKSISYMIKINRFKCI